MLRAELSNGPKETKVLREKVMAATDCSERTFDRARRDIGGITEYDKNSKCNVTRLRSG